MTCFWAAKKTTHHAHTFVGNLVLKFSFVHKYTRIYHLHKARHIDILHWRGQTRLLLAQKLWAVSLYKFPYNQNKIKNLFFFSLQGYVLLKLHVSIISVSLGSKFFNTSSGYFVLAVQIARKELPQLFLRLALIFHVFAIIHISI